MTLGKKIQILRKKTGFTQTELADKLFVSRSAISKWERNIGYPNIESLKDISEIFEVSLSELLDDRELITYAILDKKERDVKYKLIFFSMIDFLCFILMFLPLFSLYDNEMYKAVNLMNYNIENNYIISLYYITFLLTFISSILMMYVYTISTIKNKREYHYKFSFLLTIIALFLFIVTNQAYLSFFYAISLVSKGIALYTLSKQ